MATTKIMQRTFNGGEISPEMNGQITDGKYQSGLAKCRNFIAKPQGPIENRPGFAFVREVKTSAKATRLIPFTYSTTQTMVVEMGEGYLRFHTEGATLLAGSPSAWSSSTEYTVGKLASLSGTNYYCIAAHTNQSPPNAAYWYPLPSAAYEIPSPYTEADLFDVHYVQSADVMTLVHPNYPPMELLRNGATEWVLRVLSMSPIIGPPVAGSGTPVNETYSYKVTAMVGSGFSNGGSGGSSVETLPSSAATCDNDLSIGGYSNLIEWTSLSGATGYRIYRLVDGVYKIIGTAQTNSFSDNSSRTVGTDTPPATGSAGPSGVTATAVTSSGGTVVTATPTTPSGTENLTEQSYVVTSVSDDPVGESIMSAPATCDNNLYATGAFNTIEWPSVAGATRYYVYRRSGGMYGYVGQATGTSFVDDNIAPDMSKTPPYYTEPFLGEGNYPGAVGYFEQRRCFGGTTNQPQNIWMTKSGTESNMSYSLPIRDDDRIAFRVAAREANTIRHIVPLSQLLIMTSAAEWRVAPLNSDAVTPTTISVRPQSHIGASNAQPVVVNNTLIFGSARGGHVRELAYNWQYSGFITGDLSLRAAHLFDTYDIVDMAYVKAPQPVVWFVSSSGRLLGLTYVPEQQVGAWHWHDTDGVFESCCAVAEGSEDVLYCVIRREIDGSDVRYIERMASRQFSTLADAFFVDCGATYSGAPADNISGLDHLEGKTVSILADGAVHPQKTVTGGAITLDYEASKVHVGLPITADAKTLPFVAPLKDGSYGQGRPKNVSELWLRVERSSGMTAGPDENNLRVYKPRTNELYGQPPALRSEEIQIALTPAWESDGQVLVRQSEPLPITIVSAIAKVVLGG